MGRYEEALERAKAGKPIDEVFPELKESEDERIRKWIINFIEVRLPDAAEFEPEYRAALAYLEKQKYEYEVFEPVESTLEYKIGFKAGVESIKQEEQKPADQGVKGRRGRIGCTPEHIRKKAENFLSKMEPPYDADDICSAYETGAMESVKLEWSEEDEYYRNQLIVFCENCMQQDSEAIRCSNWLKSLRPQPHWKPSEEQMAALSWAINYLTDNGCASTPLELLKFDLKKLM